MWVVTSSRLLTGVYLLGLRTIHNGLGLCPR